ncbi:MAG: DUF3187 family protein, partial [Planctomycetes bacterium]|nr:DUF3187 family protein [Planctomycetota bacterium]
RDTVARDQLDVDASENGTSVFAVEPGGLELMDLPLTLTWNLTAPRSGLGLALRGGVELPTGDESRGYGNGGLDGSIGVLLEHDLEAARCYGHLQHTFAGSRRPRPGTTFEFADVSSAALGIEVALTDNLCGFVQAEYETSTLRPLDIPNVAREQMLIWVGGRYRVLDGSAIEFALGEDLKGHVSPDFTAWLSFATGLW